MPPKKSKKPAIIILAVIVVILVLAALGYFGWKKYSEKQRELRSAQEQLENLKKSAESSAEEATAPAGAETAAETENPPAQDLVDEYTGWKIYNNYEVGYQLKYPADWTIKETSEYNDIISKDVKYVTVYTPDKKYFLHWGLRYKGDNFAATDRTGLGAGDMVNAGTKITILGTDLDVVKQVYKGQVQEMFYPNVGETKTTDGKYYFVDSFTKNGAVKTGDPDMTIMPSEKLAEKILQSVVIIPRTVSAAGCASTLTSSDKATMVGWKKYTNNDYHYTFKYPQEWTTDTSEKKRVAMHGDGGHTVFQFLSAEMTAFDYLGYTVTSTKNTVVACQSAKTTYLSNGDDRMIFTQFKKDGTDHLIMMTYKYMGASLSSDMVEAYDMILKSVEFGD